VRRQVVVEGMRLAIAGVAIGLVVALGASGLIGAMLYDVEPTDPLTFTGVLVLTLVVAAAACYLPARRASRLDPLAALRSD
jgi:ABC-type antimicrobial peptide transport system permease subunit